MMLDTYQTIDSSADQNKRTPFSGSRILKLLPGGGLVLATALHLFPNPSTGTVPVEVVHQDNGIYGTRVSGDFWYEQIGHDADITQWYRLVGDEFVLGEMRSEAKIFVFDEPAQEGIMPQLERSLTSLKDSPTSVSASDFSGNYISQDILESAAKFLKSVHIDDDISNDGGPLTNLENHLHKDGINFVKALHIDLRNNVVRDSITATTLVLLGRVEHPATHPYRLNILLDMLTSPKARVRDGAVAGLGYMMSREAIPNLEKASAREENPYIRRDIVNLLRLLTEM